MEYIGRRWVQRLFLLAFVLVFAGRVYAQGPALDFKFNNVPPKLEKGAAVPGSVSITLSGFSKPVDLNVILSFVHNQHPVAHSKVVKLTQRKNGTYTLSIPTDFGFRADANPELYGLVVFANTTSAGESVEGQGSHLVEIVDPESDIALQLKSAGFNKPGVTGKTSVLALNYTITNYSNVSKKLEVTESISVLGAPEMVVKPVTHVISSIAAGDSADSGDTFPLVFKKPGKYAVQFTVSCAGANPITSVVGIEVKGEIKGTKSLHWLDASCSPNSPAAGKPFMIYLKYSADDVPITDLDVRESVDITGPEALNSSKTRTLELVKGGEQRSTFQCVVNSPGDYTMKAYLLANGYVGAGKALKIHVTPKTKVATAGDWVRGEPKFNKTPPGDEFTTQSYTYTEGDKSATASWNAPPAVLHKGDIINCSVTFTGDASLPINTHWDFGGCDAPNGEEYAKNSAVPSSSYSFRCAVATPKDTLAPLWIRMYSGPGRVAGNWDNAVLWEYTQSGPAGSAPRLDSKLVDKTGT